MSIAVYTGEDGILSLLAGRYNLISSDPDPERGLAADRSPARDWLGRGFYMEPVALSLSENGRDVKKNPPASLRAGLETMLRIGEGSITALLGGR
jgi:hypothetical protein